MLRLAWPDRATVQWMMVDHGTRMAWITPAYRKDTHDAGSSRGGLPCKAVGRSFANLRWRSPRIGHQRSATELGAPVFSRSAEPFDKVERPPPASPPGNLAQGSGTCSVPIGDLILLIPFQIR